MRSSGWTHVVALVLGAVFVSSSVAQQPTGPATHENVPAPDEAPKPPAAPEAKAAGADAVRPAGTLVRPKDGVQHPDLDKAWAVYEAAVDKVAEGIRTAVAKQFAKASADGNLSAVKKWKAVSEAFDKTGTIPAEKETERDIKVATATLAPAREGIKKAYDELIKALTKQAMRDAAMIEEAEKVEAEWKSVASSRHRIDAGKPWQPTIEVVAGKTYVISAQGKWTQNVKAMPWQGPDGLRARIGEGQVIEVNEGTTLKPTKSGTLYFELFGNFKGNDRGFVEVEIR